MRCMETHVLVTVHRLLLQDVPPYSTLHSVPVIFVLDGNGNTRQIRDAVTDEANS
jgi:hypothetical protein